MKSFEVTIKVYGFKTYTVEAQDYNEARDRVWDQYSSTDIELDSDIESVYPVKSVTSGWDSVAECVNWLHTRPDPKATLLAVIAYRMENDDLGFAKDVFNRFVEEFDV